MRLYGAARSERDVARLSGRADQFFGVRLATLSDSVERGVRVLQFRTGTGFSFEVLVDRCMDLGGAEFQGAAIGWRSPTGFRHPGLHENADEGGLGWLRSFSGLMVTGGLDHTLFMASEDAAHFNYPSRKTVEHGLHGRVANIPARLIGYGERWDDDECTLWCEGSIVQSTVFGEHLELIRRIEAKAGESRLTLRDRVVNRGFSPTPHMFLYHINLGYPLLDEGSEYIAPVERTLWASHAEQLEAQGVGYLTQPGPRAQFVEQVFEHALRGEADGTAPVALVNRRYGGGQGLGFSVEVDLRQFPCHFQWQNYQEGLYAIGLEPSTNHALGRNFASRRGELQWLQHGESRTYVSTFSVLENNSAIDEFERRVRALAPRGASEYPDISAPWSLA